MEFYASKNYNLDSANEMLGKHAWLLFCLSNIYLDFGKGKEKGWLLYISLYILVSVQNRILYLILQEGFEAISLAEDLAASSRYDKSLWGGGRSGAFRRSHLQFHSRYDGGCVSSLSQAPPRYIILLLSPLLLAYDQMTLRWFIAGIHRT